ncbi:response regulator transcription factor [Trinickia caryophylli]|uniref:Two component transcriptional regulator, LuxR family n=1 Tax=Trinickia caryophylli TaxID=28094 RepID=A0A1X7GW58_TRICW|nr:response regulator transcription factor [Trinickia caryophylli]PMS08682.1 DNA-binding response regulator [Trinickia caryophylli]TRX18046.1 response regulator transcription factor [Trinickia caryophylli]WQE11171.1 response regulator transcription factor [Trinickia caryophylli]SMF75440.1 two component transcriptional regulator, LuxR family [Trinickia caryophylli]GLU35333.1 transcriptional regulator [Trinickia caryophylli]
MRFAVLSSEAERRDGLKALLRQINRQARFCEARDWLQSARALRRMPADLLVVDWSDAMRIADLRSLVGEQPSLRIAAVVDDASPGCVRPLMDEGVHGVIPRTTNPKLIVRLLELVLAGGHYAPHRAFLHDGHASYEPPQAPLAPVRELSGSPARRMRFCPALSPRQEQIMRCVHMGSTNKMIARTLGISEGTVKIHLASIFQQLGAPNRAAAVAIYNGWLAPHLEVLRADEEAPEAAVGQPCAAPLRQGIGFKYALPRHEEPDGLPLAAEPDTPFRKTESHPG